MGNLRIYLVVALVAFGVGYWLKPQPEVKIQEKIKIKRDVRTVIIEKPDGTKVTKIESKDRSLFDYKLEKKPAKKEWLLGGASNLTGTEYQISVNRRVFGDIYLGGSYKSDRSIMVNVHVLF